MSQNLRFVDGGTDLLISSSPSPFLKEGSTSRLLSGMSSQFQISPKDREHKISLNNLSKYFTNLTVIFGCFCWNYFFCILIWTHCLLSFHWMPLKRGSICLPYSMFLTPSHQIFIHIDRYTLSLLFSRLNSAMCLSLSSHNTYSKSLTIFTALHIAFHWTHCSISISLFYWELRSGCNIPKVASPEMSREEGLYPLTAWLYSS